MSVTHHFLLAYFLAEDREDGEAVRFAVSAGPTPTDWISLAQGRPVLTSDVGERGARDPFLVRDPDTGRFFVLATDLRIWPDDDWQRAVRYGSPDLLVWESDDLVTWSAVRSVRVGPPDSGDTWAPKAFRHPDRPVWVVFWSSALYEPGDDRSSAAYHRILRCETSDFREFGDVSVHLHTGYDVIDMTFLSDAGRWYRFSKSALGDPPPAGAGRHLLEEVGASLDDPDFATLAVDVGQAEMARAEGPAVARHPTEARWYLLADEFGMRGYQLFETTDLASGRWRHLPDARLPEGARHGSLLQIDDVEYRRLLAALGSSTG